MRLLLTLGLLLTTVLIKVSSAPVDEGSGISSGKHANLRVMILQPPDDTESGSGSGHAAVKEFGSGVDDEDTKLKVRSSGEGSGDEAPVTVIKPSPKYTVEGLTTVETGKDFTKERNPTPMPTITKKENTPWSKKIIENAVTTAQPTTEPSNEIPLPVVSANDSHENNVW